MNYKHVCQILLNVTLISVFIGIFFFTYGKTVEEEIIKEQSEYIAKDIASDVNIFLTTETKTALKTPGVLEAPNMEEEDKQVEESNKELVKKSIIVFSILFSIGISVTIITKQWAKVTENIFLESIVILSFVAFTEFIFLTFIAKNYRIADNNYVKKQMLESIKNSVTN